MSDELVKRWEWLQLVASAQGPKSATVRHLLLTMALYMNQRGEQCFPSQRTLAVRTGLSERSIRTASKAALRDGWIRIYGKRPAGKQWKLYEYVATVPSQLLKAIPTPPFEQYGFSRAEVASARSRGFAPVDNEVEASPERAAAPEHDKPLRTEAAASPINDFVEQGPWNTEGAATGALRAANGAEGAAIDDSTCGNSFQNVRKEVPTNLSGNLSENLSKESSIHGALARTARSKADSKIDSEEQRERRIRKALEQLPAEGSADIAKIAGVKLEEVERVRRAS